jgi:polar amino acid transport system substrate-binding protein
MSQIKTALCVLMFVINGLQPLHAAEAPLRVVTEELPPYNMTIDGRLTGFSTEVVEAVLVQTGLKASFHSMPWARAYETALSDSNVLIYSIARLSMRESLFKWVGVIAPADWGLFSAKNRTIALRTLEDARAYQIATVNGEAGEQYLQARGFSVGLNLQPSNTYEQNYQKLKHGRVDLWIANTVMAKYLARQAGEDPAEVIKQAYPLTDFARNEGLYMAFSVHTSDTLVERFRLGLEQIKQNGVYEALEKKWL